ncbi:dihydrofolate reductase [Halorubrum salinarum]|uniref:dihydrofolate reductase n=1 Tax=Halorubrum salinarum TaxID=2739057 RepID=A0A7D3Y044_9EURY|nr:dihydrofolate reductase [Halorubrum salinarum]QKG93314.1 dihydrofolate reductase [Halorubrum salinarum]
MADADAPGSEGDADTLESARDADPDVVLVAAVADNGVIGDGGGMPWHYPADLAHFKRLTTGHPVIVGRKTYERIAERIGGPLPDRTNVVLTTRSIGDADLADGAVVAHDIESALARATADAAERGVDAVYVIGGATVYAAYLDRADRMVITEIPERPDGDTRFPEWDADAWAERDRETDGDLAFVTYERRDAE